MKKSLWFVVILAVVVALVGVALKKGMLREGWVKNVVMLDKKNKTPITVQTDVSYFPDSSGYFARPTKEGSYPGVVMIHENRGLRPEIKETADQLAKEGYMVLAVDLYKGKVVETQDEARAISSTFDQKTGTENLKAAVKYLREKGATKIASLGWCFGGGQSLQLSLSGEKLNATVIYYGRLATGSGQLKPISWPVLGIFAGDDQSISEGNVRQFEEMLKSQDVSTEIYIYPGVKHAFANPSGMNYAARETKDAWSKTISFLKKYLK